jgi:large subunit ribosomal protein L6
MSRIGKKPIPLPSGVSLDKVEGGVRVKGPKGTLSERLPEMIAVEVRDGAVVLERPDDAKQTRAYHGLARALVANMVRGVVEPFAKELEIQGVGYRAEVSGGKLNLLLGFSHPVEIPVPEGLSVSVDRNVIVRVEGIDRQRVGQFAADLRRLVRRKAGKAAAGTGA